MPLQKAKGLIEERRIFRYIRTDAWESIISQADVIAGIEKENVRCLYFDTPGLHAKTNVDSCIVTISQKHINRIKNAMLTHLDVCSYEKIEFPMVLDGSINTFEFAPEESFSNTITIFNLSSFRDGVDVAILGNPPYKGKEVLNLYDDISKILLDNGVNQKYLALDS